MAWSHVVATVLAGGVGFASGVQYKGWADGSTTTAVSAAVESQQDVSDATTADRAIQSAAQQTETAVERVRIVTRTVEVAPNCPPGAGPVSGDIEFGLRALAESRSASIGSAGSSGVQR